MHGSPVFSAPYRTLSGTLLVAALLMAAPGNYSKHRTKRNASLSSGYEPLSLRFIEDHHLSDSDLMAFQYYLSVAILFYTGSSTSRTANAWHPED
jgi:hypothetical protein